MDGCIGLQWELEVGGGELRMRDGLSVVAVVGCLCNGQCAAFVHVLKRDFFQLDSISHTKCAMWSMDDILDNVHLFIDKRPI